MTAAGLRLLLGLRGCDLVQRHDELFDVVAPASVADGVRVSLGERLKGLGKRLGARHLDVLDEHRNYPHVLPGEGASDLQAYENLGVLEADAAV